jgi:hypothetical protein
MRKTSKIILLNVLSVLSGILLIFTPRSCTFFQPNAEQEVLSKYVQNEEDSEDAVDSLKN